MTDYATTAKSSGLAALWSDNTIRVNRVTNMPAQKHTPDLIIAIFSGLVTHPHCEIKSTARECHTLARTTCYPPTRHDRNDDHFRDELRPALSR